MLVPVQSLVQGSANCFNVRSIKDQFSEPRRLDILVIRMMRWDGERDMLNTINGHDRILNPIPYLYGGRSPPSPDGGLGWWGSGRVCASRNPVGVSANDTPCC